MASGASQMTDDCGCHGDGANEEVICGAGLAGWPWILQTGTRKNDTDSHSLNISLFLLHRHTQALAACLQLHSLHLKNSLFSEDLLWLRRFLPWDKPGGPECSITAGRELGDTLWSQVIKPQGVAAVGRFWSLTAVTSIYDTKETTFTPLWAPAWALITQN